MSHMNRWADSTSEVYRELEKLVTAELKKAPEPEPEPDLLAVKAEIEKLEQTIKSDPKLRQAFKAYQEKFASDPEYRNSVAESFVDGVMLLDLDD